MVHPCNPSIQQAEVEGSQIPGLPGLHNETLSQKQKTKNKNKPSTWVGGYVAQ
jgi:hypothetical protein